MDDKTVMSVGTKVTVRKDSGEIVHTETRSEPWQLAHGAWVVLLKGITGGYDLDRVESTKTNGLAE